jgi:beta-fructofuranosidase
MFTLKHHHIGDPWFFVEDGIAHMWFLTQPTSLPADERGKHWDVGYAVSSDLTNWDYRGLVLKRGWGDAWDSQKLATGHVIKRNGLYWMAYTGHRRRWFEVQRAGMACSDDLIHWRKLEENPVTEATSPWYDLGQRERDPVHCHWRDPFLIEDAPWMYQLMCAEAANGNRDATGVVGRARSRDMRNWEVVAPLDAERITRQMECPNMHFIEGRWHLVFSCHPGMISNEMKQRFPDHSFTSAVYSMVSDHQWGPYKLHGIGTVQPADAQVNIYAGQLVRWRDQWYLLGFLNDAVSGAKEAISDPIPVEATPEGIKQI